MPRPLKPGQETRQELPGEENSGKFDVLIVGASLAGSSAALYLARAGHSVCLFDKSSFPRIKPCGEGLSALGRSILVDLGLEQQLSEVPHQPLSGYNIHWNSSNAAIRYTDPSGPHSAAEFGLGIKREFLDNLLIEKCRRSNLITVFESTPVRSIKKIGTEFEIPAHRGSVTGRRLILADGGNSPSAALLGISPSGINIPKRSALTANYIGSWIAPVDEVQIFIHNHISIFVTPVGGNEVSVAILADPPGARILASPSLRTELVDAAFQRIGFIDGRPGMRIGCSNLNSRRRRSTVSGVYLIGDAAEQLDPIGGLGMTHALVSAKLAAAAVSADLSQAVSPVQAQSLYQADRESAAVPLRGFTRLVSGAFSLSDQIPIIRPLIGSRLGIAASREAHKLPRLAHFSGFTSQCILFAAGYK